MQKYFNDGDFENARKVHYSILPVVDALFSESNPVPLKEALHMMGIIESPEVRLPLLPMSEENRENLRKVLESEGYI